MEVELESFRKYRHAVYKFSKSKITLLKGQSGAGKSTILEAIFWCFYGRLPRPLVPLDIPKKDRAKVRSYVRITLEGRTIYRQTRPKLLKVVVSGIELRDEEAQNYINDWLGVSNFWLETSYLRQKQCNALVMGSAADKLNLITSLATQGDDPSEKISKVDAEIKAETLEFTRTDASYKTRHQIYLSRLEEFGLLHEEVSTFTPSLSEEVSCQELEEELSSLQRCVWEEKRRREEISSLTFHLPPSNVSELKKILELLDAQIEECRERANLHAKKETLSRASQNLNSRLEALSRSYKVSEFSLEDPGQEITFTAPHEVNRITLDHQAYTRNLKLAQDLNVEYSLDALNQKQTELSSSLQTLQNELANVQEIYQKVEWSRRILEIEEQVDTLDQRIDELETELDQIPDLEAEKKQIDILKQKIQHATCRLECPECQTSLRLESMVLKVWDDSCDDQKNLQKFRQELKELESLCSKTQKNQQSLQDRIDQLTSVYNSLATQHQSLQEKLGDFDLNTSPPDLSIYQSQISSKVVELNQLRSVRYIEAPKVDLETIHFNNYLYLRREILTELEPIDQELKTLGAVEFDPNELQKCQKERELTQRHLYIAQRVEEMSKDLVNLEELEEKCAKVSSEVDRIKSQALRWKNLTKIHEEYKSLEPLRVQMESHQERIAKLGRLKRLMIDAEHASYEKVTELINLHVNEIIQTLFFEPIRVKLSMFGMNKTSRTVKPSVNLEIYYDGMEMDPCDLSWGQRERVSIALIIATTKLSSSPLIMMDEPLASLSCEDDREMALKALIKYGRADGKIFLYVGHEVVFGWFDEIIEFERLT